MNQISRVPGSFRDPSGSLFFADGNLYRQVNESYKENYESLMKSGLYDELVKRQLLVNHEEVDAATIESAYKVLKPVRLKFISYPYEWTFSQLKDAALLTLQIQSISLKFGMSLKDASAYNIQFIGTNPVLIDTLSFEKYENGKPWVAYKQFCQHFVAPLALMAYKDDRLNSLLKTYVDGIPLDLANLLLPVRAKLNRSVIFHISLHSRAQQRYSDKQIKKKDFEQAFSTSKLHGILASLDRAVRSMPRPIRKTEWDNYYGNNCNYNEDSFARKKELVAKYLSETRPKTVWDLGSNTGAFSDIASKRGIFTVAFDIDYSCVEHNYSRLSSSNEQNQLPLILDITNPSPSIGWNNTERLSLKDRGPADMVFALALIHHLAISNNIPLRDIALWFSEICRYLIIEFVPKSDSQVKKLLASREDIFPQYTISDFGTAFSEYFKINDSSLVSGSERTLFFMENRSG